MDVQLHIVVKANAEWPDHMPPKSYVWNISENLILPPSKFAFHMPTPHPDVDS